MPQIFELRDAKNFFHVVEQRIRRYETASSKSTEDILFIVMGLNHLREWIAPRYEPEYKKDKSVNWPRADSDEKKFSRKVYDDPNHRIIRNLCNATKHAKQNISTETLHGLNIDDWDDFDSVVDFDDGPPSEHLVDGVPIMNYVEPLLTLYRGWFSGKT